MNKLKIAVYTCRPSNQKLLSHNPILLSNQTALSFISHFVLFLAVPHSPLCVVFVCALGFGFGIQTCVNIKVCEHYLNGVKSSQILTGWHLIMVGISGHMPHENKIQCL